MQLEDYFEFEKFDTPFGEGQQIRVKGTRVGIEVLVDEFNGVATPEHIQQNYPTVSREQVYATITYYLHNKEAVDQYIERGRQIADAYYQDWLKQEPPPVVKRLRELRSRQAGDGDADD